MTPRALSRAPKTVAGLFINGESLFPHGNTATYRVNPKFPFGQVIDLVLRASARSAGGVRERVIVRSWTDRSMSSEVSLVIPVLQRNLMQMVHVPPPPQYASGTTPDAELEPDIDGVIASRAGSWALRARAKHSSSAITVALVGYAGNIELPDATDLISIAVEHSESGAVTVTSESASRHTLTLGIPLWQRH